MWAWCERSLVSKLTGNLVLDFIEFFRCLNFFRFLQIFWTCHLPFFQNFKIIYSSFFSDLFIYSRFLHKIFFIRCSDFFRPSFIVINRFPDFLRLLIIYLVIFRFLQISTCLQIPQSFYFFHIFFIFLDIF